MAARNTASTLTALASRCAAVLVHNKTLNARLDAIVAAHKPAAAIVSGVVATSSPAPAAPRCAALGLDPATTPGSPLQMPLMTCLVRMPQGTFSCRVDTGWIRLHPVL
jgi:hypothetical protein